MDNKLYQDEFEQFLQDEVKQHRMYPSDHIWKNIRTELHGYKAWPALTFISLFIITALTVSTLLNNHPGRHVVAPLATAMVAQKQVTPLENTATASLVADDYFQQIAPEQITAETFSDAREENIPQEMVVVRNTSNDYSAVPVKTGNSIDYLALTEKAVNKTIPEQLLTTASEIPNTLVATDAEDKYSHTSPVAEEINNEPVAEQKKADIHSGADEFLKDFGYVPNVTPRRNSKFGFQFYVTPSNSYRRLSDEKVKEIIQPAVAAAAPSQNVPLSSNSSADVNSVVRHKPAMGFEMGFALLYNMTGKLKFKTGVQLNVRQYYIETFQSTNDLSSLSLINYGGIETINFYSPYNNNTGYKTTQLDNKVYQLSIPLGVQWDMLQGKHLGLSSEASVQPTFTLNNNTYLLSTDYKHYTTGNEFIRKWNINTSVGFNITYKSGASSWQLGPQLRYQHLPTYSNQYPIKEYLIDYGVRFGFTRQIK